MCICAAWELAERTEWEGRRRNGLEFQPFGVDGLQMKFLQQFNLFASVKSLILNHCKAESSTYSVECNQNQRVILLITALTQTQIPKFKQKEKAVKITNFSLVKWIITVIWKPAYFIIVDTICTQAQKIHRSLCYNMHNTVKKEMFLKFFMYLTLYTKYLYSQTQHALPLLPEI